jgi:hypothetical protein
MASSAAFALWFLLLLLLATPQRGVVQGPYSPDIRQLTPRCLFLLQRDESAERRHI